MTRYEYTAIPAPHRTDKAKDSKTPGERYATALSNELNRMAANGWEYIRADVLPSEERSGLTGRSVVYHNLLIFRKEIEQQVQPQPHQKHMKSAPVATEKPVETTPASEPQFAQSSAESAEQDTKTV